MNPLVTATHLDQWSDGRGSQETLSLILSRLILAAVEPDHIDFPSGDSVNRPGYDGLLRTSVATACVPDGQSVWEIGTGYDPKKKANGDYATRTTSPDGIDPRLTTFVFVTSRRWQGKEDWAKEKRDEGVWRDVRALDAVDIEQWLVYSELCSTHIAALESVYHRLTPSDSVKQHSWLFDRHPEILAATEGDWEVEQRAIQNERLAAGKAIRAAGYEQIVALADTAEDANAVGNAIGSEGVGEELVVRLLAECLRPQTGPRWSFAAGLVWSCYRQGGWPWVERLFARSDVSLWPADLKVGFALALPSEGATWDWVEGFGAAVASPYWCRASAWVTNIVVDAERAIRTFLANRRPFSAFQVANMATSAGSISAPLALEVLQAVTAAVINEDEASEPFSSETVSGFALDRLLDVVDRGGGASDDDLARVEWIWLAALEHTPRGPRTLHRGLESNPAVFAHMVGLIFPPRGPGHDEEDRPEPNEEARLRAAQAFQLLHEWRGLPGRDASGGFDPSALRQWVVSARAAVATSGRSEVGTQQIGAVLARSPNGADGLWPHEGVRDLIEEVSDEELDKGVYLGIVNGRGVTCRALDAGGQIEWELANRYQGLADAFICWPRTARILREVAKSYRREAQRHDADRDLNEYDG